MTTTAKIAHRLIVLESSQTRLGTKASVALYLGDEEVFCDEVSLWKARSREAFIKGCLEVVDIADDAEAREKIDKWLRAQNQKQTYDFYTFT